MDRPPPRPGRRAAPHAQKIAMSDPAPNNDAAAGPSPPPHPYDRWTLRDPSSVSYGYFSGSNNSRGDGYPDDAATATTAAAAATSTSSTSSSSVAGGGGGGGAAAKKKGFYATTAINYTNGPAHMGHAYEGATSDAIARYARLTGDRGGGGGGVGVGAGAGADWGIPYFVTGADEHGEKIAKAAESEGRAPIEICDKVSPSVGRRFGWSSFVVRRRVFYTREEEEEEEEDGTGRWMYK